MEENGFLSKIIDLQGGTIDIHPSSIQDTLSTESTESIKSTEIHDITLNPDDIFTHFMSFFSSSENKKQSGGGDNDGINEVNAVIISMYQKYMLLFFVLSISIIITFFILSQSMFRNMIFGKESENDLNFETSDPKHGTRYKMLIRAVFFFTLFLCIITCIVYILISFILACVYETLSSEKKEALGNSSRKFIYNSFFTYKKGEEREVAMEYYFSLIIIILVGFIWYILYFLFNKRYFTSITYPKYTSDDKTEWDGTQKFLLLYGFSILTIMFFAFIMMNIVYCLDNSKVLFVYYFLALFTLLVFTGKIFKNVLTKSRMYFLIWIIITLMFIYANPYIIYAIFKCIAFLKAKLASMKKN